MEKEKILEIAQKDKNRGKEYEREISVKSTVWGGLITLLIGISLFLVEYCIKGTFNSGLVAIGMTAAGVQSLYEGIKNKKVFLTIAGIIQLIIALLFILIFIWQVVLR